MNTRRDGCRQAGVTLVELVVSIVIVAVAASAVLGVLATTTQGSADPMIRHQAVAIAEAYLEEIALKPTDDPDGVDGEVIRSDFDDVDDYHGLADVGARDQFGNPLAGLGSYDVSVSIVNSAGLPAAPAADVYRIDVNAVRSPAVSFTVSGYRLRY